ncbi:uncharacterized protein SPPG_02176 [Spizellomyces punctatus DAOM BR117]|uniref:VASt domain-containing protein n=1 Tax=Spizellomyces punctatus (strain DAOM BR117) TaxID=645134 RepID=A0A0L0HQ91_SPIPD|nr:uncharacterized protein SPPG_02176 [Spizellomyces punctatus DAOM BR117]KND03115.1 hypothetical protein SPPG_02176 [Spizellomyces punctatus DAOM BR117]|eukprot:XP_016611154.1 hypothetical protein SPPG_02176 [Spizellomyces punctatus DAOM BR117]
MTGLPGLPDTTTSSPPQSFLGIPELDMTSPFLTFSPASLAKTLAKNDDQALLETKEEWDTNIDDKIQTNTKTITQNPTIPISSDQDPIPTRSLTCACQTHPGRCVLDAVYRIGANEAAGAIFGEGGSEVIESVCERRGCTDLKIEKWGQDRHGRWDNIPRSEFSKVFVFSDGNMLTVAIEDQHVVQHEYSVLVVDVTTLTPSLPYGTVFSTVQRYCITPAGVGGQRGVRVRVHAWVEFSKKVMLQDAVTKTALESMALSTRYLDEALLHLAAGGTGRLPYHYERPSRQTDILPEDVLTHRGLETPPDSGRTSPTSSSSTSSRASSSSSSSTDTSTPSTTSSTDSARRRLYGPRPILGSETPSTPASTIHTTVGSTPAGITPTGITPGGREAAREGYFTGVPVPKLDRKPVGPRPFGGWPQSTPTTPKLETEQAEKQNRHPPMAVVWEGGKWVEAHPAIAKKLVAEKREGRKRVLKREGGAVAVWAEGRYIVAGERETNQDTIKVQATPDTALSSPITSTHPLVTLSEPTATKDPPSKPLNASYTRPPTPPSAALVPKTPAEAAEWREAAAKRLEKHLSKKKSMENASGALVGSGEGLESLSGVPSPQLVSTIPQSPTPSAVQVTPPTTQPTEPTTSTSTTVIPYTPPPQSSTPRPVTLLITFHICGILLLLSQLGFFGILRWIYVLVSWTLRTLLWSITLLFFRRTRPSPQIVHHQEPIPDSACRVPNKEDDGVVVKWGELCFWWGVVVIVVLGGVRGLVRRV